MDTFPVEGSFKRELAFEGKNPVKPDFLSDSRFILADVHSDSGFGGGVVDTSEDNAPFFQGEAGIRVCIFHSEAPSFVGMGRYLPIIKV